MRRIEPPPTADATRHRQGCHERHPIRKQRPKARRKGNTVADPNIREVKVTQKDIDSVSEKLHAFAQKLPPGEQNVVAWLMGRAASAPADVKSPVQEVKAETTPLAQLNTSLGIPQFDRLRPGNAFAGSSIGVTGTVMF